ncbi:MAG: histidine kinase [Verrucomicrobiota bacterium]
MRPTATSDGSTAGSFDGERRRGLSRLRHLLATLTSGGDDSLELSHTRSAYRKVLQALVLLAGIGLLDWFITSEISVSTLYLVPVGLVAWSMGRVGAISMSLLSSAVWFAAEAVGRQPHTTGGEAFWQAVSRFCFFVVTGLLIDRIHALTANLEGVVQARTVALEKEVVRRKELEKEAAEITNREQERIARELHDELAGYLAGIAFRVKVLAESLDRRGAAEAGEARDLVGLVNRATDQVRGLARLLVPIEGPDRDLSAELSRLGREVETVFGITCPISVANQLPKLTTNQCVELYRIAQEAVRNAVRHSKAELVQISVTVETDRLVLSVRCDGLPWEPSSAPSEGLGLRIMHHRTEMLGGTLSISPLEEGGALVICRMPILPGSELPTTAKTS